MERFEGFYNKNYKKLMLIPLILLILSLLLIGLQYSKTGDIINKDVSLKGGVSATIYGEFDINKLQSDLEEKYSQADVFIRELSEFGSDKQIGGVIEASINPEQSEELKEFLSGALGFELTDENYSSESVGSSLGDSFYKQMLIAIILAFIFMAIVVFITFRNFVPSANVVFSAFSDMTITIAILNLIGFRFSTAGIAALLLIIGYSVDTDILMTTKTLKRKEGSVYKRLVGSMYTGLTMTITTIIALTIGYFVTNSHVLKEMFLIIVIALFIDIIFTYLMNAGILRWYLKREN